MKKVLIAAALAAMSSSAFADPGVFVGVTYAFGANNGVGITLQATSTRHENRGIVAAGVSFYPYAAGQKIGIPIDVGYQWKNAALLGGYDLLLKEWELSAGYADTKGDAPTPPPPLIIG